MTPQDVLAAALERHHAGLNEPTSTQEARAILAALPTGWRLTNEREVTPKPDGWHTYHICDGQLREVTRVAAKPDSRFAQLTCPYCGEWTEVLVSQTAALRGAS